MQFHRCNCSGLECLGGIQPGKAVEGMGMPYIALQKQLGSRRKGGIAALHPIPAVWEQAGETWWDDSNIRFNLFNCLIYPHLSWCENIKKKYPKKEKMRKCEENLSSGVFFSARHYICFAIFSRIFSGVNPRGQFCKGGQLRPPYHRLANSKSCSSTTP